ncbi:hypothetical protein KC845_01695, partial [Candidatus Kaiserbacteria bacterium]|nr:hypothetical protein [Candidatus Kaiserbacteria bacterium]
STTDLLSGTNGAFSAGSVVTSPSSITSSLDVDQNFYTELEYAIVSTINASDGYCLRVTNNGTDLDSYATVAEMSLSFDPTISSIILNEGNPITLQPGATTTVYATGTVSDLNGYSDLVLATSTIYRSGAGAACVADTNNCYISNTSAGSCSFTDCAGSTCTIQCQADIYYNADPTDDNIYEGEEWLAYVEVEDAAGGYDFSSAMGVELMTLRYISTNQGIDYGTLEPAQDTGANNASTTIYNLGNDNLDIDIEATDLSNGLSSIIPATEQKFSTSTFTYNSCGDCGTLSSSTIQSVPLDLPKPSTPAPFVNDVLYWGINVPFGTAATSHQGVNTLYAVGE